MSELAIPKIDRLEPQWLSEVMQAAGFTGARVSQVHTRRIGTGQVARCFELKLTYADEMSGVPKTLVAKVPSDNELSLQSATAMGIYTREVEFYRDLAPRLGIRLPEIYFAEINPAGDEFFVLMQDLAPAEPGDQLAGCSAAVARSAVLELVGLQAPTWCDASLAERFVEPEDGFFSDMHGLYNQMLPAFIERYADNLSEAELGIIKALGAHPNAPLFAPVGSPFCLEHRDYRLDNFMIDEAITPPTMTVVDWQGLRIGRPLNDVALCLAGGLEPDVRRACEEGILKEYHANLLAAGVAGFHWNACWHEYRRASFAGFGLTVVAAMTVEQTPRGDVMFTTMASRYAQHALDMHAHELFEPS